MVEKYVPPCTCYELKTAFSHGKIREKDIARCDDCGQMWEAWLQPAGGMQWDSYPAQLKLRHYKPQEGRIQGR